ncbi:hypothetical protein EI94DRAFT_110216 [Lactarius quietus]|nr:hypothetical protein EI94DRAFT_110216 [Lactarius quietus]
MQLPPLATFSLHSNEGRVMMVVFLHRTSHMVQTGNTCHIQRRESPSPRFRRVLIGRMRRLGAIFILSSRITAYVTGPRLCPFRGCLCDHQPVSASDTPRHSQCSHWLGSSSRKVQCLYIRFNPFPNLAHIRSKVRCRTMWCGAAISGLSLTSATSYDSSGAVQV